MSNRIAPHRALLATVLLGAASLATPLVRPLSAQRAPTSRSGTRASTTRRTTPAAKSAAKPTPKPAPVDSVLRGFQVDTLAEPIPETLVPKYPASLRAREVRGSVTAEFVVDTLGRIEPTTFRVITSDDPAFTMAVRDLIPDARYLPAINEGHLVRQIVRQTFLFDLDVLQRPTAPAAGARGTGSPP